MQNFDVIIIGGGASGLACAISVKREDISLSVAVLEKCDRAGKKLSATGNGQGNISNADLKDVHFHGSFASLAARLINGGAYDVKTLFDCLFVTDGSGRVYPSGKQASALTDCLLRSCGRAGVEIMLGCEVVKVEKGYIVTLADGRKLSARVVVMAFGGKAQRQFGTDGSAYSLAHSMGHSVTELLPSIVQLKCDTQYIKTLKGIRAECIVRACDKDGGELCSTCGDVIFTDYGVSGNAVFYCSSYMAGREGAYLSLAFAPAFSEEEILSDIQRKVKSGYPAAELLSGTLHNQIGRAIIRRCDSSDPARIAREVKNFTLPVYGSLGFDYAQVTKGGVPADEVDEGLQSKLNAGLFFAGEALDLDGDCGGYNLTWAFVSGMHAAKSAVNFLNNYD